MKDDQGKVTASIVKNRLQRVIKECVTECKVTRAHVRAELFQVLSQLQKEMILANWITTVEFGPAGPLRTVEDLPEGTMPGDPIFWGNNGTQPSGYRGVVISVTGDGGVVLEKNDSGTIVVTVDYLDVKTVENITLHITQPF